MTTITVGMTVTSPWKLHTANIQLLVKQENMFLVFKLHAGRTCYWQFGVRGRPVEHCQWNRVHFVLGNEEMEV